MSLPTAKSRGEIALIISWGDHMKYLVIGAIAIGAAFATTASYATPVPLSSYPIEQSVNDLTHVGFGSLAVDTNASTGTNDSGHYDYIYKFTLDQSGYLAFNPSSSNAGEAHTILYDQDPTGLTTEDLYHDGDPREITPANAIDIGIDSVRSLSSGASFDTAGFGNPGGIITAGTYYLRLFGTPAPVSSALLSAISLPTTITGSLTLSAVATTPIPAALPLFASALGGLGFLGWRRKKAMAA
jgi:hypothetical protein